MLDKKESEPKEEFIGGGFIENAEFKIDYDHFADKKQK